LEANIARQTQAGALQPDSRLEDLREVRVLLSCRSGLAGFLREELAEHGTTRAVFHPTAPPDGRHETADHLELSPRKPFALEDLFSIRCWSSLGFPLGGLPALPRAGAPLPLKELARLAGSPLAWKIMRAFTGGPIRYRWEFPARRIHATCARELSERVHALRPGLLNDPRQAPWEMRVAETPRGIFVTLLPKFRPDPRFAYRTGDVPAASHPPLAAAMARFAEVGSAPFRHREHIWDPFCGSGLELAECALRDASAHLWGTDLDPAAHRVAAANIERARTATTHVPHTPVRVFTGDFRDAPKLGIPGDTLTLVITNPPLGKRVPKKDLADLMQSLFSMAQRALVPGGRLVLINPCAPFADKGTLRLQASRRIDLGFAHFPLEKYVQGPTPTSPIFLSRRSEEGRNTPPRKNAAKTPRPQKRFR
jgi:SAM-dependent methyltransferase